MEDSFVPVLILSAVVIVYAVIGGFSVVLDARTFSTITHECKTKGRIQNDTTRIFCQVEEVKSNTN